MNVKKRSTMIVAALAYMIVPAVAQAQTVYTTLADFLNAVSNVGVDTFDDVSITGSSLSPMARAAGPHLYSVAANTSTFFGAGSDPDHWLSTNIATDEILFNGFSPGIVGIGGFFFGSDVAGAFVDNVSLSFSYETAGDDGVTNGFIGTSTGSFFGVVFDGGPITSFRVRVNQPDVGFQWPTVNDLRLGQAPGTVVPEPSTYALVAAGLAAMMIVARRRRV